MVNANTDTVVDHVKTILDQVADPEIPVLTIADMGVLRDVRVTPHESGETSVEVVITPTYTGCPAMDMIAMQIRLALLEAGYRQVTVTTVLSPPWTTDWMSEAGKAKLEQYGIAPPRRLTDGAPQSDDIPCPLCHSTHTRQVSYFGSTACKALYKCLDCHEPFDYFKCH